MAITDAGQYRANVGLALFNRAGQVFLGRRVGGPRLPGGHAWQMPQGGVDAGEALQDAALRELEEEIGVSPNLVAVLDQSPDWLTYDFPGEVRAALGHRNKYRGQRQKWFALRFLGADEDIRLDRHTPEFDLWRWASLAETPKLIIPFKRAVYEEVARRFARFATPDAS